MENTLYYTFSTIAQALAGAIALLGAFVLYRVQSIDRDLYEAADAVLMSWQDDQTLQQLSASGDMDAVISEIQRRVASPMTVGWSHHQQSQLRRAQHLLPARAVILAAVRPALWFAATVMCGAVIALSLVTLIACNSGLAV